jgi:hypothetical protein
VIIMEMADIVGSAMVIVNIIIRVAHMTVQAKAEATRDLAAVMVQSLRMCRGAVIIWRKNIQLERLYLESF